MSVETIPVENEKPSPMFEEVNIGAEIHNRTPPPSETKPPETFDPSIHCQNSDGSPKRNKDGSFRRKPLPKNPSQPATVVQAEVEEDKFNQPAPDEAKQMVFMVRQLFTMLTVKLFGDEWKLAPAEQEVLDDVWARYVHYKGWDLQTTPELVLAATMAGVFAPRVMSPTFWNRFKRKPVNAYTGDRQNPNRENNTSQDSSSPNGTGGTWGDSVRPVVERVG